MTVQTLRTAPGPQPPRQPKPHRITRTGENSQEIRATPPRTAMHRRNADPTIPATRGDFFLPRHAESNAHSCLFLRLVFPMLLLCHKERQL